MTRAIVLLSGGLDSATVLAMARSKNFQCYALSVEYGQRHRAELDAAARVAGALGAHEHRIMRVDLAGIGGSALTDARVAVPETPQPGIPVDYVPARNTLFLSLALGWAEVVGAREFSSASTLSIIPAIRTAVPPSLMSSKSWHNSPPKPASRARVSKFTRR